MTTDVTKTATREKLIVIVGDGHRGYFKPPQEFTSRFFYRGSGQIPNPEAYIEQDGDRVRLVYEWATDELPKKGEE